MQKCQVLGQNRLVGKPSIGVLQGKAKASLNNYSQDQKSSLQCQWQWAIPCHGMEVYKKIIRNLLLNDQSKRQNIYSHFITITV